MDYYALRDSLRNELKNSITKSNIEEVKATIQKIKTAFCGDDQWACRTMVNEGFAVACEVHSLPIVKLLVTEGADDYDFGLMHAFYNFDENRDIVDFFIGKGAECDGGSFRAACDRGNLNEIKFVEAHIIAQNTKDTGKQDAKQDTIKEADTEVDIKTNDTEADIKTNDTETVDSESELGLEADEPFTIDNIDVKEVINYTFGTMRAIYSGNVDAVKYLMSKGGEIEEEDIDYHRLCQGRYADMLIFLSTKVVVKFNYEQELKLLFLGMMGKEPDNNEFKLIKFMVDRLEIIPSGIFVFTKRRKLIYRLIEEGVPMEKFEKCSGYKGLTNEIDQYQDSTINILVPHIDRDAASIVSAFLLRREVTEQSDCSIDSAAAAVK